MRHTCRLRLPLRSTFLRALAPPSCLFRVNITVLDSLYLALLTVVLESADPLDGTVAISKT